MPRVILSTIGTSLLTQQIQRDDPIEKNWYGQLRDTANTATDQMPPAIAAIVDTLKQRAEAKLTQADIAQRRSASAELNGIYGIYRNKLSRGQQDLHYLIATDTHQGKITATLVQDFLCNQGIVNVSVITPTGLTTASTSDFSWGIDSLLQWVEEYVRPLRNPNQRIIFNLVGGFKALQGYLNTIGMFYADEITYIFEGTNELITIPRLPITFNLSTVDPHRVVFARLAQGQLSVKETAGILETFLTTIDQQVSLSNWGKLMWNQVKEDLLTADLLSFPRLLYTDSFRQDYDRCLNPKDRLKLQETLAKVSYLLDSSNGDGAILRQHGGILYSNYTNRPNIEHFRITQDFRVSCHLEGGNLTLYRYGNEPIVNANPQ